MVKLRLVGKKGSKACIEIRRETGIRNYTGKTKTMPDAIINYGLAGARLDTFFRRFPSARRIPMLNRSIGYSKLTVVNKADRAGILVPESRASLRRSDDKKDWIEKRTNSIGGIGICKARGKGSIAGKYYQKYISNRAFEIRVHAFSWLPKEQWRVQKRYGAEGEIAWNFKNGGHFVSVGNPTAYKTFVDAMEVTEKALDLLNMSFGAADFLVDSGRNVYFIEINSAPGFSELSKPIYVGAFNALKELPASKVLRFAN